MNYLARKIGVWYHDYEWAEKMFSEVFEHIPLDAVREYRFYQKLIVLTDDTTIKFVCSTSDGSRGYKFDESYVQYDAPNDGIRRASICTNPLSGRVFVLGGYNDFCLKLPYSYYSEMTDEDRQFWKEQRGLSKKEE